MTKFAASPWAVAPNGRLSRGTCTGRSMQRLAQVAFRRSRIPDRESWFVGLCIHLFIHFVCFRIIRCLSVLIGAKGLNEPVRRTLRGELRHVDQRAV